MPSSNVRLLPVLKALSKSKKVMMMDSKIQVQVSLDHRRVLRKSSLPLSPPPETFNTLGGRAAIARLIDGLYDRIETDAFLRPAFNHDLVREREKQKRFFEAWLGGDPSYFDAAWPPGLKAVHESVSISHAMAKRWLSHFLAVLGEVAEDPVVLKTIKPYITRLAVGLVNRKTEPVPKEPLRDVGDPRFIPAVQRNDAAGLAALATERPHVFTMHGPKLLLVAALRGKENAAKEILRQGVNVNSVALPPGSDATTDELPMLRITPLCGALANHREVLTKLLLQHGAQYDIFTAAYTGDLDAVQALLDLAPELVDVADPGCDVAHITPLLHAVFAGQFEVARLLLQRGAAVGANSVRMLRAAANRGDEQLVNLLLNAGATPTGIGAGTWVLHATLADKLMAQGASVNDASGRWIGLCCTGNSGHKENSTLARAMLRCGADVAARYKGRTALHCAAKAGFLDVARALLEHGSDVNALDDRGQTPLDEVKHAGKSIDKKPMQRLLITHGAKQSR